MDDSRIVVINGVSLNNNWFDMDFRERYLNAADKYAKAIDECKNKLPDDCTPEEEMAFYKECCESTFALFDEAFGEGTAEKIFEGRHDFKDCLDAVSALATSRTTQNDEIEAMFGNKQ